jgi:hypothetical protein
MNMATTTTVQRVADQSPPLPDEVREAASVAVRTVAWLSCMNSKTCEQEKNAILTLIRAATQQPEVVTVGALVKEENDVLLFEGYKGDFKTAQQNVEHALRVIAKAFPHGLKIVEG